MGVSPHRRLPAHALRLSPPPRGTWAANPPLAAPQRHGRQRVHRMLTPAPSNRGRWARHGTPGYRLPRYQRALWPFLSQAWPRTATTPASSPPRTHRSRSRRRARCASGAARSPADNTATRVPPRRWSTTPRTPSSCRCAGSASAGAPWKPSPPRFCPSVARPPIWSCVARLPSIGRWWGGVPAAESIAAPSPPASRRRCSTALAWRPARCT